MIKIIISGTSDGFYPRYATDGILDDAVSQNLLDRRRLLSRGDDRLYKEGYSFQPLSGVQAGILYHKLILLYDGFGRDGFMMASLFLPDGELLEGNDIKDALDSIIRDYKSKTINGMANVELDWTFVKNIADELNAKVQLKPWKKHPIGSDSSRTALITGVGDRVGDYFKYPNPLDSDCSAYGQVFLTESLLDPKMVSEDVMQGYKVLTAEEVDIDDVEYIIEYENEQAGAMLIPGRSVIKKKELDKAGSVCLGKYTMAGYRDADVYIHDTDKNSPDGITIVVKLPRLMQKNAKVEFNVMDEKTGQAILLNDDDIMWSESGGYGHKNMAVKKNRIDFYGSDCDKTWHFAIKCAKYEEYKDEIRVDDGDDKVIAVKLAPQPLWSIDIQFPNGRTKTCSSGVPDDMLDVQIDAAKRYLTKEGLVIDKDFKDSRLHRVTIYGKKRETEFGETGSGSNTGGGGITSGREKYFLSLDEKSRNYSLFRNYREKTKLKNDHANAVDELKFLSEGYKGNAKENIDAVIRGLESFKSKQADSARRKLEEYYNGLNSINPTIKQILDKSKAAIRDLKKIESIPEIVPDYKVSGIIYNEGEHRLEKEDYSIPKSSKTIHLGHDKFDYSIPEPKWHKGGGGAYSSVVQRKLRTPYKIVIVAIIAVIVALISFIAWNKIKGSDNDSIKALLANEQFTNESIYCGDTIFNEAQTLYLDCCDNGDTISDSFRTFKSFYEKQNELKREAERQAEDLKEVEKNQQEKEEIQEDFERCSKGLDDMYNTIKSVVPSGSPMSVIQKAKNDFHQYLKENFNFTKSGDCWVKEGYSEEQLEKINSKIMEIETYLDKATQKTSEETKNGNGGKNPENENTLYQKCIGDKATVNDCDKYLNLYDVANSGAPSTHIVNVKAKRNTLMSQNNTESKKVINNSYDLFEALEKVWESVEAFDNKYEKGSQCPSGTWKRREYVIINLQPQPTYKEIYKNIKDDQKIIKGDKLSEIEKAFKK